MDKTKKIKSGHLFVVSAPTGGGKSTIVTNAIKFLIKKIQIERVITYTTRPPRIGEIDHVDYIFISKAEFIKLKSEEYFFEVTNYNDQFYGSPKSFLSKLQDGISFIAVTDRTGILSYKNLYPKAICIWITPPSLSILTDRLKNRGSESAKNLAQRLLIAENEIAAEEKNPLCQYHIINADLEKTIREFTDIVSSHFN